MFIVQLTLVALILLGIITTEALSSNLVWLQGEVASTKDSSVWLIIHFSYGHVCLVSYASTPHTVLFYVSTRLFELFKNYFYLITS